ncbi:Hypothetical protein SRAE_X000142800 [Strongyloides ratti]|uniref:Uncharacterized protein n=1 Tax=Strongyloides ratti TaxID=34506 RepID=A0A090KWV2_STRRB|nr:Hypothetical protein SRAE_X000142800 [Strongyloides ratti]CEF59682.1 Hypothetical protein SRAE_X000142800 [Strongyloides ratti]
MSKLTTNTLDEIVGNNVTNKCCNYNWDDLFIDSNNEFLEQNKLTTDNMEIEFDLVTIHSVSHHLKVKPVSTGIEQTKITVNDNCTCKLCLSNSSLSHKLLLKFNFFESTIINAIIKNYGDDCIANTFVLSNETLITIYNELDNKKNNKRFETVEKIINLAIKYIVSRKNRTFDKINFMKTNENIIINILKKQMNFSVRGVLFVFIYLLSSESNTGKVYESKDYEFSNRVAASIYMTYFTSSSEEYMKEEIPIVNEFEFRMVVKSLYDRIFGDFSKAILPLDKDTENILPQFLYLIECESFDDVMSETNIVKVIEEMSQMLSIIFIDKKELLSIEKFNCRLRNIYFAVAFVILKLGYHAVRWDPCYKKFVNHVNVWKHVMSYIVNSEISVNRNGLINKFNILSTSLKNYKKDFELLSDIYNKKVKNQRKLICRT